MRAKAVDNKTVLRQFLSLPVILGTLLIATGGIGIYVSKSSSSFLMRLNDTALGPTLAFDEITSQLNELDQNILRLSDQTLKVDAKEKVLKKLASSLKKISKQVERQSEISKGLAYSSYLDKWVVEWNNFSRTMDARLVDSTQFANHIHETDLSAGQLIENMSNINTFIQSDVKDILEQSTAFSKKALISLIVTLGLGVLIGAVFSYLIVMSIRRLFTIIAESKKNMQTLLDNLDQGFVVFDFEGKVQPEVSKAAKVFFGKDPADQNIIDVVPLDTKSRNSFKGWHELVFGGSLSFDSFLPLAPKNFEFSDRYIELDFRPIFMETDAEKLNKVICIASDKTEERKLRLRAEAEAMLVKVVMTILSDRGSFVDFVLESRKTLRDLHEELKSKTPRVDTLFRGMHSLKGGCAAFYMMHVSKQAHHFESQLSELRVAGESQLSEFLPTLKQGLITLENDFESFLKEHENVLGSIDESADRTKILPMHLITKQCQLIEKEIGRESAIFQNFVEHFVQDDIAELFQRYESVVLGIAERQMKTVNFEIEKNKVRVFGEPYSPLVTSYVHVFRNAIDHGIEDEETRVANGKPAAGTIQVLFNSLRHGQVEMLRIEIRDDGKGIDPKVIRVKAVEKGLLSSQDAAKLSDQEAIQLLFRSGFSTAEQITDLSGRGVGLEALQHEAKAMGGKAWLESVAGQGTRLIVEVPYYRSVIGMLSTAKATQIVA